MTIPQIIIVVIVFAILAYCFIVRPFKDDIIDLTSKDESKLSEEGTIEPTQAIKEVVRKAPRVRTPKKKVVVDNCEIVDREVAEKPVRKRVKKQ